MVHYWAKLLKKHRLPSNDDAGRLMRQAKVNTHRYFSYLAYEQSELSQAFSFLGTAFAMDPFGS